MRRDRVRWAIFALVGVLLGLVALRRSTPPASRSARPAAAREVHPIAPVDPRAATIPTGSDPTRVAAAGSFRPPVGTVHERAVRDDIRQRILAAWLTALPPVDAAIEGDAVAFEPMPVLDGGSIDPDYLRERIREDFIPMARACYEQLLVRRPGEGGRIVTEFVIVGDERIGGIVDEVSVEPGDGGLSDEGFADCLRGSMSTVAFRPPPGRGTLRVRYPFHFTPDAPPTSPR